MRYGAIRIANCSGSRYKLTKEVYVRYGAIRVADCSGSRYKLWKVPVEKEEAI